MLDAIKTNLTEIEQQLKLFGFEYEDGIYRFYHQSFKVYSLQDCTIGAIGIFRRIADATGNQLCEWFEQIAANGTGAKFEAEHNRDWPEHIRPIVEAFLHAKYFLEVMAKYGRELDRCLTFCLLAGLQFLNYIASGNIARRSLRDFQSWRNLECSAIEGITPYGMKSSSKNGRPRP